MEAYRIERFGSVDGIVLRSSDVPRPGLREVLMRGRRRLAELPRPDGAQRRWPGEPTKLGVIPLSDGAGVESLRSATA
jgi:hypothetical protein